MTQLDDTSSVAKQELYTLVAALGVGGLFITPLIALQAAMPIDQMATSTATCESRPFDQCPSVSVAEVRSDPRSRADPDPRRYRGHFHRSSHFRLHRRACFSSLLHLHPGSDVMPLF